MAHRHTVGVRFTGIDVPDGELHYHFLGPGERTSSDREGPDHTHQTPDGQTTSKPIELDLGPEDDDSHSSEARHKKKKKKYK